MPVTNVIHCWVLVVCPEPANPQRRRVACSVHGLGWGGGNKQSGTVNGDRICFGGAEGFWRETVAMAIKLCISSVQSLGHVRLCDPMNRSTPGLPVHHQLPEFTQTHVHRVGDGIEPSHPLSSPSPPAPNPSKHQGLFQWVKTLHTLNITDDTLGDLCDMGIVSIKLF